MAMESTKTAGEAESKSPEQLQSEIEATREELGDTVAELADKVFAAGKDLMVISVGALLDHPAVIERARRSGRRLYIPSGAIAGLDGIKGASVGAIDHVTITTRKPPAAKS